MGDRIVEVIKQRERKKIEVIEAARKWVSDLNFRVSAVLIGSYARGDFNLWSDVDILHISDTFRGTPLDRLKNLDPPPGFQIIPINIEEFKALLRKRDILVEEALRHGIILRDDFQINTIG
ncbi:MAG: nucleotidyltransferase domain-containing protein [Nitrososphaerota archaeon]